MDARAVGRISSWWKETDEKPFMKSFWMSCIGRSGTYLTMWMLAEIIAQNNMMLGTLLKINTFIGVYTGLLFHACACIKPLVYQKMSMKTARMAMDAIDACPRIPSLISAISLFLLMTIIIAAAIVTKALPVPFFCVLLNPVGAALIVLVLRKTGLRIGGAMGIGFSFYAIILIFSGMQI